MLIHKLLEEECLTAIAHARLGRLACARDNQPYVVPVYLALHKSASGTPYLYGFTTPGQKIDWMRANPLVCVEWDEVAGYDRWVSVVAFGRYEELPDAPEGEQGPQHTRSPARATPLLATPSSDDSEIGRERLRAYDLLREYTIWWQPGYAVRATGGRDDRTQQSNPLYYRIRIDRVSGLRATPAATEVAGSVAAPVRGGGGWVRTALRGIAGKLPWRRRRPP
jgi:nitroimidazol reductase NimA-like FMN-containing flavoprotein (pyridoxamine 5'-phosphate oxidase superfamily)